MVLPCACAHGGARDRLQIHRDLSAADRSLSRALLPPPASLPFTENIPFVERRQLRASARRGDNHDRTTGIQRTGWRGPRLAACPASFFLRRLFRSAPRALGRVARLE